MASVAIQFMNRVNDFLKLHGIDDEAIKTLNSVLYFKSGKFIYQKSIRQFMYCNYIDEIFQKFKWSELFDESGYTKEEVIKWRRLRGSSKGGSAPNKRKSTKKRIAWNKGKKLHYDTWSKGKTKYDHPSLMKMSEDRKGELNPYHSMSEESKIKMAEKVSASMKLAIKEGRFTPKTENRLYRTTSKLIYNNKSYRSSWELGFQLLYPEFNHEKFRLEYFLETENTNKIYIVDFINYDTKEVVEVKPLNLFNQDKNIIKENALIEWCKLNGYTYKRFTDIDMSINKNKLLNLVDNLESDDLKTIMHKLLKGVKDYENNI